MIRLLAVVPIAVVLLAAAACTGTVHVGHQPAPARVTLPTAPSRERDPAPAPVRAAVPTARTPVAGTPLVTWQPLHFAEPTPPPPAAAAAEPAEPTAAAPAPTGDDGGGARSRSYRRWNGWYGPHWYGWPAPWHVPAAIGIGVGIRATHTLHRHMFRAVRHGASDVARSIGRLFR
jgi:hypothetical protein